MLLAMLTTSRKATAATLVAFLAPLAALFASEQDITWRVLVACVLAGLIGGLTVWATGNTEPYEPQRRHAADTNTGSTAAGA